MKTFLLDLLLSHSVFFLFSNWLWLMMIDILEQTFSWCLCHVSAHQTFFWNFWLFINFEILALFFILHVCPQSPLVLRNLVFCLSFVWKSLVVHVLNSCFKGDILRGTLWEKFFSGISIFTFIICLRSSSNLAQNTSLKLLDSACYFVGFLKGFLSVWNFIAVSLLFFLPFFCTFSFWVLILINTTGFPIQKVDKVHTCSIFFQNTGI